MKLGFIIKGFIFITAMLAMGYVLNDYIDEQMIERYVHHALLPGEIIFLFFGALLAGVGLSRQVIAFLGGYAFGLMAGIMISMLAVIAGCMLTYLVSRFLARDYFLSRFTPKMERLHQFLDDHTFSMTLLIRLLPVGSNVVINVVAGASRVRPWAFFAGSGLGYIPQMVIFALLGSGLTVDPLLRITSGLALFVVSGLLGFYLYRRYRSHESLSEIPVS